MADNLIIQCVGCRKKFHENGFDMDRLGRRRKTCLECKERNAERKHRKLQPFRCVHQREKLRCKLCNLLGYLSHLCRARINKVLPEEVRVGRTTVEIIGCTIPVLKEHLERQFKPGMTWLNMGEWQMDHIIPLRPKGHDVDHILRALNYLNIQPLWKAENVAKFNRMPEPIAPIAAPDMPAIPEPDTLSVVEHVALTDSEIEAALTAIYDEMTL